MWARDDSFERISRERLGQPARVCSTGSIELARTIQ
jgi:hypothetical protein